MMLRCRTHSSTIPIRIRTRIVAWVAVCLLGMASSETAFVYSAAAAQDWSSHRHVNPDWTEVTPPQQPAWTDSEGLQDTHRLQRTKLPRVFDQGIVGWIDSAGQRRYPLANFRQPASLPQRPPASLDDRSLRSEYSGRSHAQPIQSLWNPHTVERLPPLTPSRTASFRLNTQDQPSPSRSDTVPANPASAEAANARTPDSKIPGSTAKVTSNKKLDFELAAQPQLDEHYQFEEPQIDCLTGRVPFFESDFLPDPIDLGLPYDECAEIDIYQGKWLNRNQRPLIELGRPYYFLGELPESYTFLGKTNLAAPRFLVYGDYRTALAHNTQNGNSETIWAHRLNLDLDLKLTGTERFHAFMGPLDRNNRFTRGVYDDGQFQFISEMDAEFDTAFFEGDLGAIVGGIGGQVLPFEMPIAIGLMPLLFQNGIWFEDAIAGAAVTFPASSNPRFDISNFDVTFFAGFDQVNSPAFGIDDNAARLYGCTTFLEAWNGYLEAGYAYLDDHRSPNRSYHNVGVSYTRRHGAFLSSSYRLIANMGQNEVGSNKTANGALLLWENSLITSSPYNVVPYFNLFAGIGRPQSVARAGNAGGILRNTGILFESDALTGYPTLDDTGNDAIGGALGLNLLSSSFDQQLVVEAAIVNPTGNDPNRNALSNQYGVGVRYQIPISNAAIIRCDGMYGILKGDNDVSGLRVEFRHKF